MKPSKIRISAALLVLALISCNLLDRTLSAFPPAKGVQPTLDSIPTAYSTNPSPQETTTPGVTEPVSSPQACLVGTWEITGLDSYLLASIPSDLAEQYELEYKGTDGKVFLSLSNEGDVVLSAEQLEFLFDARIAPITIPLTVSLNGAARGSYTATESTITTTNMDTTGLSASAKAVGQDVIEPAQIIGIVPLLKPPYNNASYTCQGDSLELELPAYPESTPPLVFRRVD